MEQDTRELAERLRDVRLLAMDVDGVLTDGTVEFADGDAPEVKRFHVADGLGLQLARLAGLTVVWITGRSSECVRRRATELGVERLYENAANKSLPIAELMGALTLTSANIAYMGDDLNDLPAFSLAGLKFAPASAGVEIKALADLVTERAGGNGAVREMCDVILKTQGKWNDALTAYLGGLLATPRESAASSATPNP
jgi:3-deoxy-D-manno-octulosonate 8-phosphate phosphatase (KDO 8-P phosphatase)